MDEPTHARLPASPLVYEIAAWPWLDRLARRLGRTVTLGDVPAEAWDDVAAMAPDVVWLMGVWQRSPAGRAIPLADDGRLVELREILPDLRDEDVAGSPYCVREYVVDARLGGPAGLAAARRELARRGIRLMLDFVPNHVVQVDAFSPALREAAAATLVGILDQCDAVRCDMAMLLLNDVFARTWGLRVGPPPAVELWTEVIARVRAVHPDALLVAEAYWDTEWRLQQLGFDGCYDKRLYDRLLGGDAEGVRLHLGADLDVQRRLVRFIENHDEPRAATAFAGDRHRAAAVAALTLPGIRLVHEGQAEGRLVRLSVFLGRAPDEPSDADLAAWYARLFGFIARCPVRDGDWALGDASGWPGDESSRRLLVWTWQADGERSLVVVNLGGTGARGLVRVASGWSDLRSRSVELVDPVHGTRFERTGDELLDGLCIDLAPWASHCFLVRDDPVPPARSTPEVRP